jgi:tetratricopeptide (TPR) repeat protein
MRLHAELFLVLFSLSGSTLFGSALPAIPFPIFAQQSVPQKTSPMLCGTVRNAQGQPVSSAVIHVASIDQTQVFDTTTDTQGNYSFSALPEGTYSLRAGKSGYAEAEVAVISLQSETTKTVNLTLELTKNDASKSAPSPAASSSATSASGASSPDAPKFFDPPNFTISGVTDTASPGGHGSDAIVRTHEALARDTASLGKAPTAADSAASAALEKTLREQAERDPQSFEANRRLGKCLLAEAKAGEAIPYLDRAGHINPTEYDNAYDLALANFDAGHYDRARQQAQALLPHHDTAALHHLLAEAQEKLGDFLEAVREYQRATELDPREPYFFDWGSELLLHHAPEPAIEVFVQGNRLFPKSARMLLGLAAASFERGDVDQAVRRVSAASDLAPDDAAPYLFLGKMELAQNGASDEVLAMLCRFLTLYPENAAANYYYAVALWKREKLASNADDAATVESLLHNALHIDPNFAAAHLQLGIVFSEKQDFEKAITEFRQAIQTSSADSHNSSSTTAEEAHYRLAQAYRKTGQVDKAKAELQLYDQMKKESAQKTEQQRRELGQFVYTLRGQPSKQ